MEKAETYGLIAQEAERYSEKVSVGGSNPSQTTLVFLRSVELEARVPRKEQGMGSIPIGVHNTRLHTKEMCTAFPRYRRPRIV